MADCVTLKRIEEIAAALNERGLVTLDDLRMCISRDVNTGIRWVSVNTGTSTALLMALLIAEAGDHAGRKGERKLLRYWRSLKTFREVWRLSVIEIKGLWRDEGPGGLLKARKPLWAILRQSAVRPKRIWHNRRKYWLDVLAVVVLLSLLIGLVFRFSSLGKENDQYVAVKQGAGLPVFHKLADDVEMKSASGSKGSFTNTEDVRGRYTLTAIPAGAMLQTSQLLSKELSQKIQEPSKFLSVPLKAGAYSTTLTAPSEVKMVLSPRTPDLKTLAAQEFDVILLSIESSGDAKWATVVLPEDKFKSAATILGSHDVFLVQSVR